MNVFLPVPFYLPASLNPPIPHCLCLSNFFSSLICLMSHKITSHFSQNRFSCLTKSSQKIRLVSSHKITSEVLQNHVSCLSKSRLVSRKITSRVSQNHVSCLTKSRLTSRKIPDFPLLLSSHCRSEVFNNYNNNFSHAVSRCMDAALLSRGWLSLAVLYWVFSRSLSRYTELFHVFPSRFSRCTELFHAFSPTFSRCTELFHAFSSTFLTMYWVVSRFLVDLFYGCIAQPIRDTPASH